MKAVVVKRWGSANEFELVEDFDLQAKDLPEGFVRVKIQAIGFNPVDYKIRLGRFGGDPPKQGLILGVDFTGIIESVGNNCKRGHHEGEQVYGLALGNGKINGTYAQYIHISENLIGKTPKNVPAEESAGMVVTGLTALECHARGRLQPHHTVLITGASGGVGSSLVQLVKNSHVSRILVTAGTDKSVNYLHSTFGIPKEHIINYQGLTIKQIGEKVIAANGGRGVDVVFDLFGGDMKHVAFEVLGMDGNIVTIVEEPDHQFKTPLYPAINPNKNLFAVNGTFHMVFVGAKALAGPEYWHHMGDSLDQLTQLLESGQLAPSKVNVLGTLSRATVKRAHEELESHHNIGKLIMLVD